MLFLLLLFCVVLISPSVTYHHRDDGEKVSVALDFSKHERHTVCEEDHGWAETNERNNLKKNKQKNDVTGHIKIFIQMLVVKQELYRYRIQKKSFKAIGAVIAETVCLIFQYSTLLSDCRFISKRMNCVTLL